MLDIDIPFRTKKYVLDSLNSLNSGRASSSELMNEVQSIIDIIELTSAEKLLSLSNDDNMMYAEDGYPVKYDSERSKTRQLEETKKNIVDKLYDLLQVCVVYNSNDNRIKWTGEKTQLVMLARDLIDFGLIDATRESLLRHFETKDGPMQGDGSDLLRGTYKGEELTVLLGGKEAPRKYRRTKGT